MLQVWTRLSTSNGMMVAAAFRDPAHRGGNLVRRPVVQHPPDQRGETAPRQHHGDLGAGLLGFTLDQFLGGVHKPVIGSVDHRNGMSWPSRTHRSRSRSALALSMTKCTARSDVGRRLRA